MTDKERLKIIRETPHYFTCDVMRKDFLWLFGQSEQIEIIKDTGKNFEQAALNYAEENKKLREALEFYANKENYDTHTEDFVGYGNEHYTEQHVPILDDEGTIARNTLEELK